MASQIDLAKTQIAQQDKAIDLAVKDFDATLAALSITKRQADLGEAERARSPMLELIADVVDVRYTKPDGVIGGYYEGTVVFIVRNAENASATATNVMPVVLAPPTIVTMPELRRIWGRASAEAQGISPEPSPSKKAKEKSLIWAMKPAYNPIHLIGHQDFQSLPSDEGYRIVAYRNDMGLTVMPEDAQAVSELKLPGFRGHFPLCGEGSTNGQETSSCLPLGVPG
jgi:hypothetical protein